MELTCSECGEGFLCRDVLNPAYGRLAGFWEHEPRGRLPAAFVRTIGWLVLPNRFWRRVELHHEIRPGRLVAWAVGLPVMFLLLGFIARVSFFAALLLSGAESWSDPYFHLFARAGLLLPYGSVVGGGIDWHLDVILMILVVLTLPALAYPAVLLALVKSRRLAKLRVAHVARAAAYALIAPTVLAAVETCYSLVGIARALIDQSRWGIASPLSERFYWAYFDISEHVGEALMYGLVPYAVWLAWYWNRAFVVGFRMHRAWLVWALLSVIAGIVGVFAVLFMAVALI
ncbi:MAG: hypothetical protein EA378_03820 [Phycisphaerales bacterium]|nr:MAG: hypothetical protein EA378_03820 [Phycisphaerales bacterium]